MDWKNIVKNIEMKKEMQEEIMRNCRREKHVPNIMFRYSKAAAVLLGLLVCSMGSLTVYAAVSAYRARLEAMDKEEVQEYYNTAQEGIGEAYTYSREMTEEEKTRFRQLQTEYENGKFPEGEIALEESEGALWYNNEKRMYYLPERELTDEELLQIADMWAKIDYSLQKVSEKLEAEGETAPVNVNAGEPIEVSQDNEVFCRAKEIIENCYQIKTDDYEVEITYQESDIVSGSEGYYYVRFAKDDLVYGTILRMYDGEMSLVPGSVTCMDMSITEPVERPRFPVTQEKLQSVYEKAKQIVVETLGVEEEITVGYCLYDGEETETSRFVVLIKTADGACYELGFWPEKPELTNERTYEAGAYEDVDILSSYTNVVPME